jgi:hypothetical protein
VWREEGGGEKKLGETGKEDAGMQAARARTERAFGVQFGRREERGRRNGTLPAASLLRVRAAMPQNERLGCLASEKNGLAKNGRERPAMHADCRLAPFQSCLQLLCNPSRVPMASRRSTRSIVLHGCSRHPAIAVVRKESMSHYRD